MSRSLIDARLDLDRSVMIQKIHHPGELHRSGIVFAMVEVNDEQGAGRALETALARILPAGWRATLQPAATQDGGVGRVLDLVGPTGDRCRAHVEFRTRAEPADVYRQLPWLQQFGAALLVAPRISPRTRGILTDGGISWLETDGDCRIAIGGLFIERSLGGRRQREPGAAETRFVADLLSGGALRIVRWLLMEPERSWTLTDMASRAGLTIGFVSRTFKTLARDAYVERERGSTRLLDRDALLDGWVAAPAPADVPLERVSLADGPSAVLRRVRELEAPSPYAITAEAAAEQIAPHARFSRVEIYVDDPEAWDRALSLTPVPRGGNVVLIRPVDRGVFDGVFERDGLSLASRPQLYVDLVRRGGAAAEAAAFIRERSVLWQP